MAEPLQLDTKLEGVYLRQLWTVADDIAYFNAVDANRRHLSQFDDPTAHKYRTLESVTAARLNAGDKLRMGIWASSIFVGSINSTPHLDGKEIGYWLDARQTGHGYATVAVEALVKHLASSDERIYAVVARGNVESQHVLERAGFSLTKASGQRLTFDFDSLQTT